MYPLDYPNSSTIDDAMRRRHEMLEKKEMEALDAQRAARYGASYTQLVAARVLVEKPQKVESYEWDWSPYHQMPSHHHHFPPSTSPCCSDWHFPVVPSSSSSSSCSPRGAKRTALDEHAEPLKKSRRSPSTESIELPLDTRAITEQVLGTLKRLAISQSSFAAALGKAQGTISDLLRNPKEWSEMKTGRGTYRKMEEFLEMGDEEKKSVCREAKRTKKSKTARPPRRLFTHEQRAVLEDVFSQTTHPSIELQHRLGEQLELPFRAVNNFFQNTRNRTGNVRKDNQENFPFLSVPRF